jgi:hypothetical protein
MAITFLDLTNTTLRRLNEVELTSSNFATVVGVHAQTKDAVNAAIRDIIDMHPEWPFMHSGYIQTLVVGTQEYALQTSTDKVDWDSFRIVRDDANEITASYLKVIDYNQWLQRRYEEDAQRNSDSHAKPFYIYRTQNDQFGVTPTPDKAYQVNYEYWITPTDLADHDDIAVIPDHFKNVIVDGAMYHTYMFRENFESAQNVFARFKIKTDQMRRKLIPHPDAMRDTRVKF